MIYSCQHCGAKFTAEILNEAISTKKAIITCKYCNNNNDIGEMRSSHTSKGYDCLEKGDFYNAEMEFNEALKPAQGLDIGARTAYIDAYLGQALAKFSVQVIYKDEVTDRDIFPQIFCYMANEERFEDDYDIQIAYELAKNIMDDTNRNLELDRLNKFINIVDGIKDAYDECARRGENYQLFIAYEDLIESENYSTNYAMARKIRNEMPSKINKVFFSSIDDYESRIKYEGAILYAIHNSNCMLVLADDDIDSRLMNLYSRFYWTMINSQDKISNKDLGFVRYKNKIKIHLPDHKVSKNVFDIEDAYAYLNFVHFTNNIIYDVHVENVKNKEIEVEEILDYNEEFTSNNGAPVIEGKICKFGSYPQRLEKDIRIIDVFKELPKPNKDCDNGWSVMFYTRSGQPYSWCLDKEINGKKYRAVYFSRYREVFSIRETDLKPSVQRVAKYTPMKIYVFAYEPIEWGILDLSMNSAVLVSSIGLDCKEFNANEALPDWESSTIRNWLNYEFYEVAFNEKEKEYIFERDDDFVSLIDREKDFSKGYRAEKIANYNIIGSEYYKCVGGYYDDRNRNVGSFWVKSENYSFDEKAVALQPRAVRETAPQFVDSTTVSVVPKIMVRFN